MYRCQQENLGGRRDLFPILTPLESGKPTVLKEGRPEVTSTSTKTVAASTPRSVAERTRASTGPVWERPPAPSMCRKRYVRSPDIC
jgi:hypothetical protein